MDGNDNEYNDELGAIRNKEKYIKNVFFIKIFWYFFKKGIWYDMKTKINKKLKKFQTSFQESHI